MPAALGPANAVLEQFWSAVVKFWQDMVGVLVGSAQPGVTWVELLALFELREQAVVPDPRVNASAIRGV
eukprot:1038719-Alexandrium_andersonii.AAC.1